MTRKELYEKMFGCSPANCPAEICGECPVSDSCDHDTWWNAEASGTSARFANNTEDISLSDEDKQKICDLYNKSDLECLEYLRDFAPITLTIRAEIDVLIMYNRLIFQYNDENYMEKEYRIRYKRILRILGIHINHEDKAVLRKE